MPGARWGRTIGSLCSGYGGLDLAALAVYGGELAWHAEVNPDAARILARHWPGVPNLGDLTSVDWTTVEPVCVLTAGFPCQDLSVAGRRAGLAEGTRSGLWWHITRAIAELRPCLVVIENVRGILSAPADSNVEPCPWCLGDPPDEPPMRALGAVLASLADLGYDAQWTCVRASDVGAPHQRARVFLTAHPRTADRRELHAAQRTTDAADADRAHVEGLRRAPDGSQRGRAAAGDSNVEPRPHRRITAPDQTPSRRTRTEPVRPDRAPTAHPESLRRDEGFAEPNVRERQRDPAERCSVNPALADSAGRGHRHPGPSSGSWVPPAVVRSGPAAVEQPNNGHHDAGTPAGRWGPYAGAIARWEAVTRPAPAPTTDRGRRDPVFVEWLMGLSKGWVTDTEGLSRSAQLTALGNGVVPQQAVHGLRQLSPPRACRHDFDLAA